MELKGHVIAIALLYLYLMLGFPPMVRYRIKNQKLPDRDGNHSTAQFRQTSLNLSTSLTKFSCPILIFLQPIRGYTRPYRIQTCFKVMEYDSTDLIHGGVEKGFAQVAQGTHGSVFG